MSMVAGEQRLLEQRLVMQQPLRSGTERGNNAPDPSRGPNGGEGKNR
jgi:hypothetical protein